MNNTICRAAFVAVFAFIASYSIYTSRQEKELSDLAKANIEALANNEGVEILCSRQCSDGIGRCWIRSNSGYCAFTGYQVDNCTC